MEAQVLHGGRADRQARAPVSGAQPFMREGPKDLSKANQRESLPVGQLTRWGRGARTKNNNNNKVNVPKNGWRGQCHLVLHHVKSGLQIPKIGCNNAEVIADLGLGLKLWRSD